MAETAVAIVGSGIAGTMLAYALASRGIDVEVFEKGQDYPYPFVTQFNEEVLNQYINPSRDLPRHLRPLIQTGDIPYVLDDDRRMRVGGMATSWYGVALRMYPSDFRTRSLFGRGHDWPITYEDLEPYYCQAESLLGVSGTDDDNPFAPPRSHPCPLPPFELSYQDTILAERLRQHGIIVHTVPQARTRLPYNDRAGCLNHGTCGVCPIGARYSPAYHLQQAVQSGHCRLRTGLAVRRVVLDETGRARALLVREVATGREWEHAAAIIILAAGAVETARLLLLSTDDRHPDGLGNGGGQVGQYFALRFDRFGLIRYPDRIFPGRIGLPTGQSHQFVEHDDRARYGGVKVEFTETPPRAGIADATFGNLDNLMEAADFFLHTRYVSLHPESDMTDRKFIELSDQLDPFGDCAPHVHHEASEFDYETFLFSQRIFRRLVEESGAESGELSPFDRWLSWSHHMGGCRMSLTEADGVVNPFGQVHGVENLFTAGASAFVETSSVNPTLTIAALALHTADYLLDQRLT